APFVCAQHGSRSDRAHKAAGQVIFSSFAEGPRSGNGERKKISLDAAARPVRIPCLLSTTRSDGGGGSSMSETALRDRRPLSNADRGFPRRWWSLWRREFNP